MSDYFRNVRLWWRGFDKFSELRFKPGFGASSTLWWCIYTVDYGFAVFVLAIGVQPVSRWAGLRRSHQPWTALANFLDAIEDGHTTNAGPILWGSRPCREHVRILVVGFWLLSLISFGLFLLALWWYR